ncbi:Uncharacterised protein r2_g4165 [Pycnogonum litorale]
MTKPCINNENDLKMTSVRNFFISRKSKLNSTINRLYEFKREILFNVKRDLRRRINLGNVYLRIEKKLGGASLRCGDRTQSTAAVGISNREKKNGRDRPHHSSFENREVAGLIPASAIYTSSLQYLPKVNISQNSHTKD